MEIFAILAAIAVIAGSIVLSLNPNSPPGLGTARTATPRRLFLAGGPVLFPGGRVFDGSLSRDPLNVGDIDVLRAGVVMGKITATGLYAPSIIGVLPSAHDSSGTTLTSLTVGVANATEIVRRIGSSGTFKLIGPPSAGGTVAATAVTFSAVNTTTGVVTITDIAVNKIAGTFITSDDGSETPLGLIADEYGIKVTDVDDADIDGPFNLAIGGIVDASQIVNYPSDTALIAWLKGKLNDETAGGAGFTFDDTY